MGDYYRKWMCHWGLFLSLMLLVILGGCAASSQQLEMEALLPEIDVIHVKENSDEALRMAQETHLDLQVLRSQVVDLDNQIVLLSEEVSSVSIAKIAEIETRLALLIEAYKDLYSIVKAIENSPAPQRAAQSRPPATFSPSSASALLSPSQDYEIYRKGLQAYNARNFNQSKRLFSQVVENFPEGSWAQDAQYWVGESYYAMGDFASAVSAFRRVLSLNNAPKAEDAMFKLGLSFIRMGQVREAREALQMLIDRYPASDYKDRAQNFLKDLK
ncbi:tetratricopeptide repeat protein [Chitinispirillales bacterium ANBcel5]|uniref:tetratricopeptide repeat protein n=1 Tax=Cellulosispirillum alkaliphilum TaxID=3039283 RepID=UPI002A52AD06|nr:tetratricopeptide repeat protein [Chitinispirillales bacterium ANBcel5]